MNLLADRKLTCYCWTGYRSEDAVCRADCSRPAGDYCQVFYGGDDVGHQAVRDSAGDVPRVAAAALPTLPRLHQAQGPAVKVFLHTCGAVYPLLPLLIEAGIDILNPCR